MAEPKLVGTPSPEEVRRRLVAARELRGLDQRQMGALLKEEGLGKTDAARLERGDMSLSPSHMAAYARRLRLPMHWFTADDIALIFSPAMRDTLLEERPPRLSDPEKVEAMERAVESINAAQRQAAAALEAMRNAVAHGQALPDPIEELLEDDLEEAAQQSETSEPRTARSGRVSASE